MNIITGVQVIWPLSSVIFRNVHYYSPTYNCFLTKLSRRRCTAREGESGRWGVWFHRLKPMFALRLTFFCHFILRFGLSVPRFGLFWGSWGFLPCPRNFMIKLQRCLPSSLSLSITSKWCNMEAHYAQYADNCHKSSVNVLRVHPPSWPELAGSISAAVLCCHISRGRNGDTSS